MQAKPKTLKFMPFRCYLHFWVLLVQHLKVNGPNFNLLVDKSLLDLIFVLVSVLFTADSRAELFHSFPSTPTLQKENQKLQLV